MHLLELIIAVTTLIFEGWIAIMLYDDIYGISKFRKLSKRKWRKFQREFMKSSRAYFKKGKRVTSEQHA